MTGSRSERAPDARLGRALTAIVTASCALAALAPAAIGSPYIHAHRGGPLTTVKGKQKPLYPEESMPALRQAAKRGFVLEMDTRVTSDGRVILMHDSDLERTTDCTGLVNSKTVAEIRKGCEIDIVGTDIREEETTRQLGPKDERRTHVPTLAEALRLAKKFGVTVNLEVNNYATNPDYDANGDFQRRVAFQVKDSAFPADDLIVQSFSPPNLDPFQDDPYFADSKFAYLAIAAITDVSPSVAQGAGADIVSPAWPVKAETIQRAHALGLQVVPYTLDTPQEVRDATLAGVDGIISDDPVMASRVAVKASPKPPKLAKAPSKKTCRSVAASNSQPAIESFHRDDSGPRVFALQFKQDIANVATYRDFRTKIECLIRTYVEPNLADDRPNVVALNEDVGVMTLATGSRAAGTRGLFADPANIPGCAGQPAPCGIVSALFSLDGDYASQEAAYASRFGGATPFAQTFLAGTDTFGRGWMQTFSDLAKRYGVYMIGSNNQAEFRESIDPTEIAAFSDPDVAARSAYVATSPEIYNEAFVWAPEDVTKDGPAPLRNVVYSNKKVPLTEIENLLSLTPGPSTGPDAVQNIKPYKIPGSKARMSIATSLPAFRYVGNLSAFGEPLEPGLDPCSDTAKYYMLCMDKLGANLVMQDEANPGRWASQEPFWQPLEWMGSSWRAVADPTVDFDYNVTPFMVGNLADLEFDGQTSITQRGLKGPKRGPSAAPTSATPSCRPRTRPPTASTRGRSASSSASLPG